MDPDSLHKDFSNSWSKETASAYLGIVLLLQLTAQTNFCTWSAVVGSGSCSNAWLRLWSNRIPASEMFLPHHVITREHRSVLLEFNLTLSCRKRSKDCFKTWRWSSKVFANTSTSFIRISTDTHTPWRRRLPSSRLGRHMHYRCFLESALSEYKLHIPPGRSKFIGILIPVQTAKPRSSFQIAHWNFKNR